MPTHRRLLSLTILALLLVSSLPLSFAEPFDPFNPYFRPIILERGTNYVVSSLGGNLRSWKSAPQWVSDGSKYVPYIYFRDEAKKCYNIQVGFVAAKVYDTGIVELYDPALNEIRVKGESWEVWSAGKKATLNAPITWSVTQNATGVFITRQQTTSKPNGALEIIYSFIVGATLKNTVKWTSNEAKPVAVQMKQVDLMDFDKVITETGTSISSKTEKSVAYLFGYGSKDFWLLMDQHQMVYDTKSLEPTPLLLTEKCLQSGEIDFAGKKVTYTFGDWTLATGEALEIDPSPATLNNPTIDDFIYYTSPNYSRAGGTSMNLGSFSGQIYRMYIEWSVSSIPDAATITDTVFKYNGNYHNRDGHIHAMGTQPSIQANNNAGNKIIYDDAGDGTVYADVAGFPVAGTGKSIDLGATADTDLKAALTGGDWFAIGCQGDAETGNYYSDIYTEEKSGVNPAPTLYVEYTSTTDYPRAGAKALTLTKAGTRVVGFVRGDSLSLTLAKAGTRLVGYIRGDTLGLTLASAGSRLVGLARGVSGAFTLASAGTTLMGWVRGVTEDITFTNAATRLLESLRDAAQTIITKQDATRLLGSIRVATQGITLTSSAARLLEWVRNAVQSIQFGDMTTRLLGSLRGATQGLTFSNTATRAYDAIRAATQGFTLSNGATIMMGWVRTATQSLTMTSGVTRLLESIRIATQNLALANAGARLFEFIRATSQSITFTPISDKVIGFIRATTQGLTMNSTAMRFWEAFRDAAQSLTLVDSATRLVNAIRNATQGMTLASTATRLLEAIRTATQGLTLTSGASRLIDMLRDATQGINWLGSVTAIFYHVIHYIVTASQGITVIVDAARHMDLLRATSQGFTLTLGGYGYLAIKYIVNVSQDIVFKSWGWGVKNAVTSGGIPYWLIIVAMAAILLFMLSRR